MIIEEQPLKQQMRANKAKVFTPNLWGLILGFFLLSMLVVVGSCLFLANQVQRDALITQALDSNSAYSAKVASGINNFLRTANLHLAFSAARLGANWGNAAELRAEVVRLQKQDNNFHSISIIDAGGQLLEAYPNKHLFRGRRPHSEGLRQAPRARQPHVSSAFTSASGNLVVFISQPIFDHSGIFLGNVGGLIYLNKESPLHTLISSHFLGEGTRVFVTDSRRRVMYHSEQERVGEIFGSSKTVTAAQLAKNGAMAMTNDKGVAMLAGYAHVPEANWAVVTQVPREAALASLDQLRLEMFVGLLPGGLIALVVIWIGAFLIARPLNQLSSISEHLSAPETTDNLQRVNAWYREAAAIRQALLVGVQVQQQKLGHLRKEAQSDPLTGLANRRVMTDFLELLDQTGEKYAVLAVDIDHFKRVNDTFGHHAGDVALQEIAIILQENSRGSDLACRSGGEEFTLILPDASLSTACVIAERIRISIAERDIPTVGRLTTSVGVACRQFGAEPAEVILKRADENLYLAKANGRNRVESYEADLGSTAPKAIKTDVGSLA